MWEPQLNASTNMVVIPVKAIVGRSSLVAKGRCANRPAR
jgi:hypothetical protein